MSQLEQAKREATRLLKLAKKHTTPSTAPFQLPIKNLSQSQEYIANINGYASWNIYEKELNKRDIIQAKPAESKNNEHFKHLLSNIDFFNQDIPFIFNKKTENEDYKIVDNKVHTPIVLGNFLPTKLYSMTESFARKNKEWKLTDYPVLFSGSTGSGKTESLVSIGHQYIKNGEGLIYIDGKGDASVYTKLFNLSLEYNRFDDYYLLNFMMRNDSERISHTFDPINPLIGDEKAFKILFGDKIGVLIHELSKCVKAKNGLVSVDNILSFLMMGTLKKISDDNFFSDVKCIVDDYLDTLPDDEQEALTAHTLNCDVAFNTAENLMLYKSRFSLTPDVDLEKVYYKRKILLIMFPALEKSSETCLTLLNIVMLTLNKVINNFNQISNTQNIILDELSSATSDQLADYVFSTPFRSANVIHAFQDYGRNNNYLRYVTKTAKTFVLMKNQCSDLSDDVKIRIMNNLDDFPPFYKMKHLNNQCVGEASVFGFNSLPLDNKTTLNYKYGYTFSTLKLCYKPSTVNSKEVYLNKKTM